MHSAMMQFYIGVQCARGRDAYDQADFAARCLDAGADERRAALRVQLDQQRIERGASEAVANLFGGTLLGRVLSVESKLTDDGTLHQTVTMLPEPTTVNLISTTVRVRK